MSIKTFCARNFAPSISPLNDFGSSAIARQRSRSASNSAVSVGCARSALYEALRSATRTRLICSTTAARVTGFVVAGLVLSVAVSVVAGIVQETKARDFKFEIKAEEIEVLAKAIHP